MPTASANALNAPSRRAAARLGFELTVGAPKAFQPPPEFMERLHAPQVRLSDDPAQAVAGADVVYTDVWVSMGKEDETAERRRVLAPYAVTGKVFAAARPGALFMHCLPAHPGEEVMPEVLDNPRSVIFDQAENRLHMQKAIVARLAASRG